MPTKADIPPPPTYDSVTGGLIQSPEISSKKKPTKHSIRDVNMAREVVKTVIAAGRNRSIINSRILAKYNAERPYDSCKLEAEGLGWRSNFTTKPLPSMIEKVAPRFVEAIQGLKYFTNSKLGDKWQNSVEKSEKFQSIITRTIRNRKGSRTLWEDIAFGNSIFGSYVVACLDEFSWFPKGFGHDEAFLPDGTKQEPEFCQLIVLKETFMPHELFEYIDDREAADAAGWNVTNTIEVINKASPTQFRDQLGIGGNNESFYQHAQRELTIGSSYMAGASVIAVYSLFAREVTGKVSHYRLGGEGMLEIFSKDDRFETMEDCLSFFSYQKGNGTMQGSKGVGREIYELAGMIDRTRNEIVDRSIMSGKTLIQGDIKRIHTFKMSIIGATAIVPEGWAVLEQKIDGNIEPFLKLDAYFAQLVDQLVGSTSPRTFSGERTTAAEVNLFAAREEEGKDFRVARFLEQFIDVVTLMQKRICDSNTIDEDAKAARKELLEFLTKEELKELVENPVAGTVRDLTPQQRQLTVAVANEKKGNPLYNQRQLEVEDLNARLGADFAKRVLLPVEDPTEEVEQSRMQNLEIVLLSSGQPVPVSPRDNHIIHLKIIGPAAEQVGQQLLQGQTDTSVLEAMLAHITEHTNRATESGIKTEELKPFLDLVKNSNKVITKLKELDAQAATNAADSEALAAEEMEQPVPVPV